MVKAIPMEDWLRGCVYHDGRHGEVMLPTDKVLQIANYIQRTRRSVSDGLIDLEVEPIADTPQTDMDEDIVRSYGFKVESYRQAKAKDEPQTDCEACELNGKADVCKICRASNYEPQTDCGWK